MKIKTGEYEIKGHKQFHLPYTVPIRVIANIDAYLCPLNLCFNPYVGCHFNCAYCYARPIQQIGGNWLRLAPCRIEDVRQTFEDAFVNNKQNEVSRFMRLRNVMRVSNLTDPFQPVEVKYRIMEQALDIFHEYDYPLIINTKGTLVAEPRYVEKLKKLKVGVQITLISDSSETLRKLEPNAPSFEDRLQAIKTLSDNGIYTMIRYSPAMPGINDDPEGLFKQVSEAGCRCVVSELLYVKDTEAQRIGKLFPHLKQLVAGGSYAKYLEAHYPVSYSKEFQRTTFSEDFKQEFYERCAQIARHYGMEFLICCEEFPEMNDWANCCGSHLCDCGDGCEMTLMMSGDALSDQPISFDEFAERFKDKYPASYLKRFRKQWESGVFAGSLSGCRYVKKDGVYVRDHKRSPIEELFGG